MRRFGALVVHPVSHPLKRTGHGTVTVGGPGKGESVDLVPKYKVRVRTATTAAVVAGSTDRERPAEPLDHGAVVGLVRLSDQGDHDLSPLLRAERGISSSRLKTS